MTLEIPVLARVLATTLLVGCSEPPPPSSDGAASGDAGAATPTATAAPAVELLDRVVTLGASATAGIGCYVVIGTPNEPRMTPVTFARLVEAAMNRSPRPTVTDAGNVLFFASPLHVGPQLVEQTLAADPTLVIAVDFLFWYGYGELGPDGAPLRSTADRLALLDVGISLLERIECPVVVGDFADMSSAIGVMLRHTQVPPPETLAALNERLRTWAAGRPQVIVVPMGELVEDIIAAEGFTIGDHVWPPGRGRRLLQRDRLHPTVDGLTAVLQLVVAALDDHGFPIEATDFEVGIDTLPERLRREAGTAPAEEGP